MLYWKWYLCVSWRQFAIYIYSIYLIADQQTKVHIYRDVQFFNIYSIYLISDQQIKVHTETRKIKHFKKLIPIRIGILNEITDMCVQVYVTIIEIAKTHNCRPQTLREISLFRNRSNSDIFVILGCHCSVMVEARALFRGFWSDR